MWFQKIMNNKKNKFFIIIFNKIRIGYIRYTSIDDNIYEISVALKKNYEGKNYASLALNYSEQILNTNCIVISKIRTNNKSSILFFKRNSYSLLETKSQSQIYFKIINKSYKNGLEKIIKSIEAARKKNNLNWMNLLKLSYSLNPLETKKIFKKISYVDKEINQLSKKLI